MPSAPNTYTIATAIKNILGTATINSSPAYANVIVGGLKDYTDAMPVAVILLASASSDRYSLGRSAKIHDVLRFEISSVIDYSVASTAEQTIASLRDTVTFLFAQSASLGNAGNAPSGVPGVNIITIVKNSEKFGFPMINGDVRRSHSFLLEVTYEYTLPLGPQP